MFHDLQRLGHTHSRIFSEFWNIARRPDEMVSLGESNYRAAKRWLAAEAHEALVLIVDGDQVVARNVHQGCFESGEFLFPKSRTFVYYNSRRLLAIVKIGVGVDGAFQKTLRSDSIEMRSLIAFARDGCRFAFENDALTIA